MLIDELSVLVTGARSGLGRALCERFRATAMTRENADEIFSQDTKYDLVIHCAHSRAKDVDTDSLDDYASDSFELTSKVLRLCKQKFILISSVSVYPLEGHSLREDDPIKLDEVHEFYGIAKLLSERHVVNWAHRTGGKFLILRLSSTLGPYSPANVTKRILTGATPSVPLSGESRFSYICHDEIGDFIEVALNRSAEGFFNLAAADTVTLKDVACLAGREIEFGPINYQAPVVSIERACALLPALRKTSVERIRNAIAVRERESGSSRL